ncbi:MAG: DnaB-like helicase C-terminal domain-containing protein [Pseudomonadota bacterium]
MLPHNIEAEQAILGALLLNNECYWRIERIIKAKDFMDPVHSRIYELATSMISQGDLVSPVTLKAYLDKDGGLKELGGPEYLIRLAEATVSLVAVRDYARSVKDLALRRSLINHAREARERAQEPTRDAAPKDIAQSLIGVLELSLSTSEEKPAFYTFDQVLQNAAADTQRGYQGDEVRLSTGLSDLDEILGGGLQDGRAYFVGADTGMGKSAFALHLARHAARRKGSGGELGSGVMIASLQMSHEEAGHRCLSMQSSTDSRPITYQDLSGGKIEEAQFRHILEVAVKDQDLPINIADENQRLVGSMRAGFRRMARELEASGYPPRLIIIDHLHLMKLPKAQNRTSEVNECANICKEIAKEYRCPVVVLAQLNREFAKREDKRPQKYDFKDSSGVEQIADAIIMLYRPAYYLQEAIDTLWQSNSGKRLRANLVRRNTDNCH